MKKTFTGIAAFVVFVSLTVIGHAQADCLSDMNTLNKADMEASIAASNARSAERDEERNKQESSKAQIEYNTAQDALKAAQIRLDMATANTDRCHKENNISKTGSPKCADLEKKQATAADAVAKANKELATKKKKLDAAKKKYEAAKKKHEKAEADAAAKKQALENAQKNYDKCQVVKA